MPQIGRAADNEAVARTHVTFGAERGTQAIPGAPGELPVKPQRRFQRVIVFRAEVSRLIDEAETGACVTRADKDARGKREALLKFGLPPPSRIVFSAI